MITALAAHLWQSTLCAGAAALLCLALRRNAAAVRFGVWLAASFKFLVPFAALAALGEMIGLRAPLEAPGMLVLTVQSAAAPLSPPARPVAFLLGAVWLCGLLVLLIRRLRQVRALRLAMRAASPFALPAPIPVMTAPWAREPALVGLLHPAVVLPEGIEARLSPAELNAVLAHELCHWRRRDNLTAALHMAVEVVFWFHPAVWWIGARMVEERERACDEHVLATGNEAAAYAESILKVCKMYLAPPLACAPGMSGADLRKRIAAIIANRGAEPLGGRKRLLLAATAGIVLLTPIAAVWMGLTDAPAAPLTPCDAGRICSPRHNPARPNVGARDIYPAASRAQREEGVVVLMLTVDEAGGVSAAKVKTTSGYPRLDDAARTEALSSWRFLPGTMDGAPHAMRMPIRVTFRMDPAR